MAQIKFILTDHENGNVEIRVDPPFSKLIEIAKGGEVTYAERYAMTAMTAMAMLSDEIAKEAGKQLIKPGGTKFKFELQ